PQNRTGLVGEQRVPGDCSSAEIDYTLACNRTAGSTRRTQTYMNDPVDEAGFRRRRFQALRELRAVGRIRRLYDECRRFRALAGNKHVKITASGMQCRSNALGDLELVRQSSSS